MYEPNVQKILSMLDAGDKVLDIGGWARPFNRANYVMDAEPYETRGYFADAQLSGARGWYAPAQGGEHESFSKDTWIQRDLCSHERFPFRDKEIDFVICSQTLEDVRDPLWVCSEMIRVGKRGYIEVPSRQAESSRGVEPNQVGWSHHRWLIEIVGDHVYFTMKYHKIHSNWRFSLPARALRKMSDAARNQWLFWNATFSYSEITIHSPERIAATLEEFILRNNVYPGWLLAADRNYRGAVSLTANASRKIRRLAHGFIESLGSREQVTGCTGTSSRANIPRS
jgi:hypothetical protein